MSETKTQDQGADEKYMPESAKLDKIGSFLSKRFGILGKDMDYIRDASAKFPVPRNTGVDTFLSDLFGDFGHIYHVSSMPLKDLSDAIPDSSVRYDRVKKIAVVFTVGSKNELHTSYRIIKKRIQEGIKAADNRTYIEYTHYYNIDPDKNNHGSEIFFLGDEKPNNGPGSSNLSRLKDHLNKYPEADRAKEARPSPESPVAMRPKQIYEELGKSVFGQEEAKKSLSVILYEHLLRQVDGSKGRDIPKTNALLIGPSGCGKTLIAKTIAEVAKVPFARIDATSLVINGYRGGMHIEQIIDILLSAANGHISLAGRGIIFLDEVDKLASQDDDWYAATVGVQKELLSIIDGTDFFYESDHDEYERTKFSFKDVLFIFGGAFEKRYGQIGSTQDLISYGFIPEFANRTGTIISMKKNGPEVLSRMVGRAVEEYSAVLDLSGQDKILYTELLSSIITADKTLSDMGGRCVGPVVRKFFEDRLFEL